MCRTGVHDLKLMKNQQKVKKRSLSGDGIMIGKGGGTMCRLNKTNA